MSKPARILVVDDNPVVLLNVAQLLRHAGYQVLEAVSGLECLQLARAHRPELVLLDVVLPDIGGVELCQQIKSAPELRNLFLVLLSSSRTSSDSQATGLEAGADGYIARPIENRELLARVAAMLRIQQAEAALCRMHDDLELRVEERSAEVVRSNEALRVLSRRLVDAQEEERRFLARELHDEIGQIITGTKLLISLAAKDAPATLQPRLQEAVGLLQDLMQRVRRLSLNLRPQMLDDFGLLTALDWHFKRYHEQTGICVQFQHAPLSERLPSHLETAVFRVVQEALTNVARHAGVKEATVRLWTDELRLGVQVEDRGAGFDAQQALASNTSNGLAGMRERAELLGGEFTLETAPGCGTRLMAQWPRRAAAADPQGRLGDGV